MIAKFSGQLVYHFLEYDRVYVLAQHVEEEPVAHLRLLDDDVDALLLDEPEADVEQVGPHPRREDDEDAIDEDHGGQGAEEQHPEPGFKIKFNFNDY